MSFCPNPECPHLKRIGRAAEFLEGIVVCSDCGTLLTGKGVFIEKEKGWTISDFQKRLIYTFGMIALWRILTHIGPPGINFEALNAFLEKSDDVTDLFGLSRITVIALGLMPYITASVAVEILALFLRPLKSWREGGYQGRLKLRRTALISTLLLGLIQGYGIAQVLANMGVLEGLSYNSGISFRLFLALTFTTGTFITIWIADRITRNGIGHGISVIILTSSATGLLSHLLRLFNMSHKQFLPKSPFEYLFMAAGISAILIAIIVFMEKSNKKITVKYADGMESYIPLKLSTAGIVPTDWAGTIIMFPITVISFINTESFPEMAEFLSPSQFSYSVIYAIIIFLLYYLFTAFFYKPKNMIESLRRKDAALVVPDIENTEDYIDRVLEIMAFAGAAYLCFIFFLPEVLTGLGFPIFVGGVGLITTVAVVLDLYEESRVRRKSAGLTKIMEFHEVQKAGLFKGILEQRGIPCLLQGYYHRSLLYFFGPYIEISALVPHDRTDEASELLSKYIA